MLAAIHLFRLTVPIIFGGRRYDNCCFLGLRLLPFFGVTITVVFWRYGYCFFSYNNWCFLALQQLLFFGVTVVVVFWSVFHTVFLVYVVYW